MTADEQLVRDVWKRVEIGTSPQYGIAGHPHYWWVDVEDGPGIIASGHDTREACVHAAAEFTRQRREEIRQVGAELSLVNRFLIPRPDSRLSIEVDNVRRRAQSLDQIAYIFREQAQWRRLQQRLKSILANLQRGMKPTQEAKP